MKTSEGAAHARQATTSVRVGYASSGLPADSRNGRLFGASVIAVGGYAFALPLLVGMGLIRTPVGLVLVLLSVYSGGRIAFEIFLGASRWLVLAFFSFTYVFLALAPLIQLSAGYLPWTIEATPNVLLSAALISALGALAFDGGLALAGFVRSKSSRYGSFGAKDSAEDDAPRTLHPRRMLAVLAVFSVASLALVAQHNGILAAFISRAELHDALCPPGPGDTLAECGLVEALVRVPPALLAVSALWLSSRRGPVYWGFLALAVLSLGITANPVSAPRFWFGAVAIGILGVTVARIKRGGAVTWLLLPALLLLLFPNLDFGRYQGSSANLVPRLDPIVEKEDFDSFQQIANGVTYVETYGYRDGVQTLSSVLFFVPRNLWQDKAPPTGTLVTAALGESQNTNVSAPLWEEAFIDFGPPGVIAILSLLGFLVGRAEQSSRAREGHNSIGDTIPLVAGYGLFVLRGSLLAATGLLAFLLLLAFIARLAGGFGTKAPLTRRPVPNTHGSL